MKTLSSGEPQPLPQTPIAAREQDTVDTARLRKRKQPKGRQVDAQALTEVQALLGSAPRDKSLLIEFLHKLQDQYGCLHARHLAALALELKLAQVEVYEVASFYHHFDIVKEGESAPAPITVRVCDGLSCSMHGAQDLLHHLQTLPANQVRVLHAPCVGRCEQAPVAVVGQNAIPQASSKKVADALKLKQTQAELPNVKTLATYQAQGGYELLRACMNGQYKADEVIQLMQSSGLRGLGGAGFPVGRKWSVVSKEPAPRLMAVNIDEGEPGTFKDRFYLEQDPHRFLEGMWIAAWVVGIDAIYIYLRDEYHGIRAMLQQELDKLANSPPVANLPKVFLRRGAGSYICGEESAMIESIEGKRGMPRLRPPYVAQVGLFGRPTLEHNLESLYWVREIIERGPQWFSDFGRRERKGLRSFSVSGRVQKPGVHVAPAGISLRELIDEYCGGMQDGHELAAYLPGGASGGILPPSMAHLALDFDTLQPHGCFIGSAAVIVLSQQDDIREAARNLMRFFKDESCGQCTPCRSGTDKALELMQADHWDAELLSDLSTVMRDASICGLGQAAMNPVDCVLKYFPKTPN